PNGSKIAFESDRTGNTDVWAMNADGTGQVDLTNNPASDGGPSWSPDGTQIAFATDRNGDGDIYKMNANGSSPVDLSTYLGGRLGNAEHSPAWSPDGTRIAEVIEV